MEIRKSRYDDLDTIMQIYDEGRAYMRLNGNHGQWICGYPQRELIEKDIKQESSYVCVDGTEIVGVFTFFIGVDPTYIKIYDGQWLNDREYGVIHRIAVASHRKGVASFCYDYCYSIIPNIKVDTHRDNIPMQNSLKKNGFKECGIIYLESKDERLAFQKA